jgi:glycosyltransferase involved in cell wall biosynthesis
MCRVGQILQRSSNEVLRGMKHVIARLKIRVRDRLRYAAVLQWLMGRVLELQGRVAKSVAERLAFSARAFRLLAPLGSAAGLTRRLRPYVADLKGVSIWRDQRIGWEDRGDSVDEFEISKGIILKPYLSPREKGVLFVSFEYNWLPLLGLKRAKALFDRYMLICAPSWSPPPFPAIWSMAGLPHGDVFVLQSNFAEAGWYQSLPTNVTPLPLLISHWIDPGFYQPRAPQDRDIDVLMVANWAMFKRQWVLFDALRRIPKRYRVVLVGQPDSGRTMADIEAEATAFGVRDQVEIRERLSIDEVTALQCRSKVSLVFSRREGSCVVVAESLFADCPVGLLQGAHIGSSAFINEKTGVMLDESRLAEELPAFIDRFAEFSPRAWATSEISCFASGKVLNEQLAEWSRKEGREWTREAVPFMCRPNPRYLDAETEATMTEAYRDLYETSGVRVAGRF